MNLICNNLLIPTVSKKEWDAQEIRESSKKQGPCKCCPTAKLWDIQQDPCRKFRWNLHKPHQKCVEEQVPRQISRVQGQAIVYKASGEPGQGHISNIIMCIASL